MKKSDIKTLIANVLNENGTRLSPAGLADRILQALEEAMVESLKAGVEVVLPGVGRIKPKDVAAKPARTGRNPSTGASIQIAAKPAGKTVKLKPAREMLALLNA